MSITTEYTNPKNRDFSDELKTHDLQVLLQRKKDIDVLKDYGMFPDWVSYSDATTSTIQYWEVEDIWRYRKNLYMELLDRCTSFELVPELKFHF